MKYPRLPTTYRAFINMKSDVSKTLGNHDTAAFAIPAGGTYGNLGRNTMRSATLWNLDFSGFRQFPTGERMRFELRGEAFNLPNTVIYGTPNASITDKLGFGTVSELQTMRELCNSRRRSFSSRVLLELQ